MRLVAPVYKAGRSDVYDLTIQGSPEFFANGVLVHNCSAYVTWCVWQARVKHRGKAGVDVMNGANWSSGWTGTLLQHGKRHTSTRWWKPGRTLVFYGNPVDHVALYVGGGMVVSHGSESGPSYLHYSYRPDFNQARAYNV
jgi:cell wall-associated NlpC family hydrolase